MPRVPLRLLPNRREFLQWIGAAAGAAALDACHSPAAGSAPFAIPNTTPPPSFFTERERLALGALADAVIPPDEGPGGAALGAVPFMDRLLMAFETATPFIWAGGPYSGRQPFQAADGSPSVNFPANDFVKPVPLDRVNEAAWRLYLYGSAGLPGGAPNDALEGKVVGLRDLVKAGLTAAISKATIPLEKQSAAQLAQSLSELEEHFRGALVELVHEAAFSAPEYGGNTGLKGWELAHYEGDSMPLGYSLFDTTTSTYRDRPDAPMAGPSTAKDPAPMDLATREFIEGIVSALGGKVF